MIASKTDVIQFLKKFKQVVASEGLAFIQRTKNIQGLISLGLTIPVAEQLIFSLTEEDYVGGPEADKDGSLGEIWFFCRLESGQQMYIKLKLAGNKAKCLSFHPAEYLVKQPYKKGVQSP